MHLLSSVECDAFATQFFEASLARQISSSPPLSCKHLDSNRLCPQISPITVTAYDRGEPAVSYK